VRSREAYTIKKRPADPPGQAPAFPKPVKRKVEKKAKRAAHADATRALREVVFARAKGKCEKCKTNAPSHMHHARGGSGRRRQEQSPGNVAALCVACHAWVHKNPTLPLLIPCIECDEPWCLKHEMHYFECPCPGAT
jgi:hypothetical protein